MRIHSGVLSIKIRYKKKKHKKTSPACLLSVEILDMNISTKRLL